MKYKRTKATGKAGVIYVEKIVNDHGSVFRPVHEEDDLGVDGFIELVNAEVASGRLTVYRSRLATPTSVGLLTSLWLMLMLGTWTIGSILWYQSSLSATRRRKTSRYGYLCEITLSTRDTMIGCPSRKSVFRSIANLTWKRFL